MLKPDFYIHDNNEAGEDIPQYRLLMEVNANSFCYVLMNLKGMRPVEIKCFQLDQFKGPQQLAEVLAEIIDRPEFPSGAPNETFLVYNYPESNLVPERYFSSEVNKSFSNLVYGDLHPELMLTEKIPWWDLYNVFRIPSEVHAALQQRFSTGKYWHFYSLQLKSHKMFNSREELEHMKVIFYTDKLVVIILKEGRLQLIQTFPYQDAKDAVYHLLNCCQQLHLNQDSMKVEISGMVDRNSALYSELHKYFMNLSFEAIEDSIKITDELREFPLHYFSSLLKMSVCV